MEPIRKYNERENLVYWKHSDGFEKWYKYDENNHLIYFKNSNGYEEWLRWKTDKSIKITQQEFEQIKRDKEQKEFLSREEVSIFELMDI